VTLLHIITLSRRTIEIAVTKNDRNRRNAMTQAIPPSTAESPEAAFYPCLKNPAVALCNEAWLKIHGATLERTKSLYTAERCAAIAFRLAMPPLSGYKNICDFIACAGYGILLGAIKEKNAGKLLYAAQVALATVPKESKTQTRTEPFTATPPPLSPQPLKKKRIRSKKPVSTLRNKGLTNFAAGGNPGAI
jgi:hypothetical protein